MTSEAFYGYKCNIEIVNEKMNPSYAWLSRAGRTTYLCQMAQNKTPVKMSRQNFRFKGYFFRLFTVSNRLQHSKSEYNDALWLNTQRSYGVTVSTLDSESSDPSSNLGRTSSFLPVQWRYRLSNSLVQNLNFRFWTWLLNLISLLLDPMQKITNAWHFRRNLLKFLFLTDNFVIITWWWDKHRNEKKHR